MKITLREYQEKDFKTLEKIIRQTWHYDELTDSSTATKLARVFLSSCLTNYTFSRVAIDNGVPIGIILANHKSVHKCPLKLRLKQMKAVLSLYLSKEGRQVMKIFENVSGIDKLLLKQCGNYPAELALFAVDSTYRGKGIGKQLFQSVIEYMKKEEVKKFYLFTDTSCNYQFYEHQGMIRRCEKEHTFDIKGQSAKMNFFIYDYIVNHLS